METVVIGDVHLTREGSRATARDLASVVREHRERTVVFAGDLFDLAAESRSGAPHEALEALVGAHGDLRRALAEHVASGSELVFLGGNHDADVATPGGMQTLTRALGLSNTDALRVRASPWFARLGRDGIVHVEHGHHYDPDNALPHPLAPPDPSYFSLGIGLMHHFVAPMRAGSIVHDNDAAPLTLLLRAFRLFGARAPAVIVRYLYVAAVQVARAGGRYPSNAAREAGEAGLELFASVWGVSADDARVLVARGARPTMASARETFLRLYWDRTIPTTLALIAGASALAGGPGRTVALAALGVLVLSVMLRKNRYRGRVPAALVEHGQWIAETTGARTVVFGHIHRVVDAGPYVNTGSFGFPGSAPGRPYVVVSEDGKARRAFFVGEG